MHSVTPKRDAPVGHEYVALALIVKQKSMLTLSFFSGSLPGLKFTDLIALLVGWLAGFITLWLAGGIQWRAALLAMLVGFIATWITRRLTL
jgi:hypothetical protein